MKLNIVAMSKEDQDRLAAAQARRERKWAKNKKMVEAQKKKRTMNTK